MVCRTVRQEALVLRLGAKLSGTSCRHGKGSDIDRVEIVASPVNRLDFDSHTLRVELQRRQEKIMRQGDIGGVCVVQVEREAAKESCECQIHFRMGEACQKIK